MSEIVRVLRLVEYIGPRSWVEETLSRSIQGTLHLSGPTMLHPDRPRKMIRTATLGEGPEVLDRGEIKFLEEWVAGSMAGQRGKEGGD